MRPGARLQAAIEILDRFEAEDAAPADRLLADWARGARYAGSKDRAAAADIVYAALRRRDSARLGAPVRDGRAAAFGALRLEGAAVADLQALAGDGPHAPAPLSPEELERLEALPDRAAAAPRADFPSWLHPLLEASVPDPAAEIAALRRRAAFDLRVNTLQGDRAMALAALAEEGLAAEPGPIAPTAIRLAGLGASGRPKLRRMAAFERGLAEPQDAASQAVALLAAAFLPIEDGAWALDVCAGGGGKTLALAAAAPPGARIGAFDIAPERMTDLPKRLARAGVAAGARVEILDRAGLEALTGRAALALVDAPCSGSGAWARQPDARWRLTPERLDRLRRMQGQALDLGAATLRPGGVLLYVTCSLLRAENAESAAAFLARRPEFEPAPLAEAWARAGLAGDPITLDGPLSGAAVVFSPARTGTDGFFAAALRRRGAR